MPTTTEEGTNENRTKEMPTLWTESTPHHAVLLMVSQEDLHQQAATGTQDHGLSNIHSRNDLTRHTDMEVGAMMNKPVRLNYSMLNSRMEERSDGTFVLYSKYEELEAQLDELQGECDLTHDLLDVAIAKLNKLEKK